MERCGSLCPMVAAVLTALSLAGCNRYRQTAAPPPSTQPDHQELREGWCVTGHVSDDEGRPMSGVEIQAHCGHGTLLVTGRATTNESGDYTLRFGPGMWLMNADDPVGIQAATISPRMPGYFERNLHRQGDLRMAMSLPTEEERAARLRPGDDGRQLAFDRFVLLNQPRRVDFVLVPAVEIKGRFVDADGHPMPGASVSLTGDALPPSSSVLAWAKTENRGAFLLTEVPTGDLWFEVRDAQGGRAATNEASFDAPGTYTVELTWQAGAKPQVTARVVSEP